MVIILIATGLIAVDNYKKGQAREKAIAEEKIYFDKSRQYVASLDKKIRSISKPSSVKDKDSCRYQSVKFARGPLSCKVSKEYYYQKYSLEQANRVLASVSTLNKSSPLRESLGREKTKFENKSQVTDSPSRLFYQNLDNGCSMSYSFYPEIDNKLIISQSCSSESSQEHFPVEQ